MTGPFIMTPEMYCTWATARNINNQLWPECIKSSASVSIQLPMLEYGNIDWMFEDCSCFLVTHLLVPAE